MKAFKNIISILIAISVSAIMLTQSFAAEDISVVLNGNTVVFADAKPIIYEDRTLIPVRAVFEKADWDVSWDVDSQTAIIGNDATVIFISIDKMSMQVYDVDTDTQEILLLDVPAMIIDDRTMIPLRAVCEALGSEVDWDDTTKTVYIETEG